ncbi:hypothetical protein BSKO_11693 [Bryopsis sp. KO-2023]|nr:hypothetical protein BSKO_11693 [Bryopsis sp. KO-2023]
MCRFGLLILVLVALISCTTGDPDLELYETRRRNKLERKQLRANRYKFAEICTVSITAPESGADAKDAPIHTFVKCSGETLYDKTTPMSELQEVDLKGRFKLFAKSAGAGGAYLYIKQSTTPFHFHESEFRNLRPLPGVDTTAPVVIDGSEVKFTETKVVGNKGFKQSGAMYVTSSLYRATVDIEDVVIEENTAEECGGLMVDTYSKVDCTTVKFLRNFGKNVGAVRVLDFGNTDFEDCTFEGVPPSDDFKSFVNGDTNVLPNGPIPNAGAISVENSGRMDLDNCTITDHYGQLGTVFSNDSATLFVAETNFASNSVVNGGALYADGGYAHSAKVFFSEFHGNTARWGGALMVLGQGLFVVRHSNFMKNGALYGGVLFGDYEKLNSTGYTTCESSAEGSRISMESSSFKGNTAKESGGVFYSKCAGIAMKQNQFHDNASGKHGGAIFLDHGLILHTIESEYINNTAGLAGGAIFTNNTSDEITLESCHFEGNKALSGGGGAIHASNAERTVNFKQTSLVENTAEGSGGAVALIQVADLDVHDCEVEGNHAGESGGAFFSEGLQKASVKQANFSRNTANNGGALSLTESGGIALKKVLLESNTAKGAGGAIHIDGLKDLNVSESTFQFNEATSDGGGAIFASKTDSLLIAHESRWSESTRRVLMTIGRGSVFTNNTAGGNGGAIAIEESASAQMTAVSIINNKGGKNGGGINVENSGEISLDDSSLQSNEAQTGAGGGLAIFGARKVDLQRIRLFENVAAEQGGAIKADSVSQFDITGTDIGSNNAGEGAGMDITGATNLTGSVVTFALNEADSSGGAMTCSGNSKIDVSRSLFDFNYAPDAGSILTRCHCNVTATDCAFKRDKDRSNNGDFFESAHKCSGVNTDHCNFWGGPWKLPLFWLIVMVVVAGAFAGVGIGVCRAFIVKKKGKKEPEAEAEALLGAGPTISYTASSSYSSYYDDDDDEDDYASNWHTVVDVQQEHDTRAEASPAPSPQQDQGNQQTAVEPSPDAIVLPASSGLSAVPIGIRVDPCSAPLSSSPSTLYSESIHNDVDDHSNEHPEGGIQVETTGGMDSDSDQIDEIVKKKEAGGGVLTAVVPMGEPAVDDNGNAGEGGPSASNGGVQGARPTIPSFFGWENEVPKQKDSDLDSSLNTEDLVSSFDSSDWTESSSDRGR